MKSVSVGKIGIPALQSSTLSADTSPESFTGCLMHVIHQVYVNIYKHLEQTLMNNKESLSLSQFMILVRFSCDDIVSITQSKLASDLMLTEATISRHTRILVAKKFLTKKKDTYSKKSFNLMLTPLGKKVFENAKKIIMKELIKYFSHINESDKKMIIKHFTTTLSFLQQKK